MKEGFPRTADRSLDVKGRWLSLGCGLTEQQTARCKHQKHSSLESNLRHQKCILTGRAMAGTAVGGAATGPWLPPKSPCGKQPFWMAWVFCPLSAAELSSGTIEDDAPKNDDPCPSSCRSSIVWNV